MKTTFTKEQIDYLWEAEVQFERVMKTNSIVNAPRWLTERVVETFEAATGKTLNKNYSCGTCVMNIYRIVGPIYFKDKKIFEEANAKEQTIRKDKHTKRNSSRKDK